MIGRWLALLLAACVVTLAITGLGPGLMGWGDMTGWGLVVHLTAGTVFAVCLAILAVGVAEHYAHKQAWGWLFWATLGVGLFQIATAMVPMQGWISSATIDAIMDYHGYAGWVMVGLMLAWIVEWAVLHWPAGQRSSTRSEGEKV